jgi:hypothetical protein
MRGDAIFVRRSGRRQDSDGSNDVRITMGNSSTTGDLLWDEQQRAMRARTHLEFIELLKRFALVFALIMLTLTVAWALGRPG